MSCIPSRLIADQTTSKRLFVLGAALWDGANREQSRSVTSRTTAPRARCWRRHGVPTNAISRRGTLRRGRPPFAGRSGLDDRQLPSRRICSRQARSKSPESRGAPPSQKIRSRLIFMASSFPTLRAMRMPPQGAEKRPRNRSMGRGVPTLRWHRGLLLAHRVSPERSSRHPPRSRAALDLQRHSQRSTATTA
jgi:hypothetical protein